MKILHRNIYITLKTSENLCININYAESVSDISNNPRRIVSDYDIIAAIQKKNCWSGFSFSCK